MGVFGGGFGGLEASRGERGARDELVFLREMGGRGGGEEWGGDGGRLTGLF